MKDYYLKLHGNIYEIIDSDSLIAAKRRVANHIWGQYGDDPEDTIKKLKIATNKDYERTEASSRGNIFTI